MANLLTRVRQALARVPAQKESGRRLYRAMTDAGISIDHDNALSLSAVWACVRAISQTLGVLNMHVYQSQPNGGKKRRADLRIDQMMRRDPNAHMTAMTLKETLTGHLLTWGNGYAEIERDGAGRPAAIWPLLPDRTEPVLDAEGALWYETHVIRGGERFYLPAADVFHLKGFGFDGLKGYDVISYAARSIGAGIAAETFGSSFFGNGTHLSGGLFHPKRLSPEARKGIREEFEKAYQGARKAFRMAVFEEGVEWRPFGLSPEASQFIETRQFSVEEVARWFGVPLHKIGHLLRATNNNIEHQGIEYVTDAILPIAVRWEQEADSKLLTGGLKRDHFFKLNVSTLMRGDLKSRYEAYSIGRLGGWLNANQICELEDLEPIGPAGDVYIVPLNYQNAEALLAPPEPMSDPEPADPNMPNMPDMPPPGNARRASREAIFDAVSRGLRRFQHAANAGSVRAALPMAERLADDLAAPAGVFWAMLGGPDGGVNDLIQSLALVEIEHCMERHAAGDQQYTDTATADRFVDRLISSMLLLRTE